MPSGMTLEDVWQEYQLVVLDDVSKRTSYVYRNAWQKRVSPTLGRLAVVDITPLEVRRAWAEWDGSQSTKTDALAVVSKTLSIAVDAGLFGLILPVG